MLRFLSLICLYCVICSDVSAETCTNTEVSRDPSPKKLFEAVIYTRICDGSAVASTEITVLMRNEILGDEGSILYSTLSYPEFNKVEWVSENQLRIAEDKGFSPMMKADGTFVLDKNKNIVYEINVEYQ